MKAESSDPYVIITRKQESIASLRAELTQREADLKSARQLVGVLWMVIGLLMAGVLAIIFMPHALALLEQ